MQEAEPFNALQPIATWARDLGFVGVQLPGWDSRVIDLDTAAKSKIYCDELTGMLSELGIAVSEVAAYTASQALAVHPLYEPRFRGFFPNGLSGVQRSDWATEELKKTILAAENLGCSVMPVLSGGFAWHLFYPYPHRAAALIDEAFAELARLWLPLLDFASSHGICVAFEPHPGSDVFDGVTFERFLDAVKNHPSATLNYDPSHLLLQQIDYVAFIEIYGERIRGFHVKDAECRPNGRVGIYGGFEPWSRGGFDLWATVRSTSGAFSLP
jgi:sugar phosphate isomerase/epimerase